MKLVIIIFLDYSSSLKKANVKDKAKRHLSLSYDKQSLQMSNR